MGKVRMRNNIDGKLYEFDAGPGNSELRKAIQSGDWSQELNPAQAATKFVADLLPPAGATAGAIVGATGGAAAGAPMLGVGAFPGGVAGGALGGAQGGIYGGVGREALYGLAGIQKDERPLQQAGRMAYEGAQGLLSGMAQGFGAAARSGVASSMMKRAVGNAQPGIEATLLERRIPATLEGRRKALADLAKLQREKKDLLAWATGEGGVRVTWKHLRERIANVARQASESDPLTMENDNAFAKAMSVMRRKAENIRQSAVARGEGVPAGQDAPLTPQQLEDIRRRADAHVKFYEQQRLGQTVARDPSPLEGAYRAIADEARSILNRMQHPATGRTLENINREIGELSDVIRTITQVAKRGTSSDMGSTGLRGAAQAASLWSGDPARAVLLGIPAGAAEGASRFPGTLSKMALSMNQPSVGRGVAAQVPVRGADALARLFFQWGDPALKPTPFGDVNPDGTPR